MIHNLRTKHLNVRISSKSKQESFYQVCLVVTCGIINLHISSVDSSVWLHCNYSLGPQDRRHMTGPGSSQQERRNTLVNGHVPERRHMSGLADRRHISPPLHINICDSAPTLHTLSPVGPQPEGLAHGRSTITIDYSQRRNGRGGMCVSHGVINI